MNISIEGIAVRTNKPKSRNSKTTVVPIFELQHVAFRYSSVYIGIWGPHVHCLPVTNLHVFTGFEMG